MKKNTPSIKARNICVVMTLTAAVVMIAVGIWQISGYKALKENCTCETTGVIVNEAAYSGKGVSGNVSKSARTNIFKKNISMQTTVPRKQARPSLSAMTGTIPTAITSMTGWKNTSIMR